MTSRLSVGIRHGQTAARGSVGVERDLHQIKTMKNAGVLVLLAYMIALALALSFAVVSKPEGVVFVGVVAVFGLAAVFLLPRLAGQSK